MRRQIPSLSALETFEAVARLGSTTRAAEELGRTQSAVSRQILNLEGFMSCQLFERVHNRLVLNRSGEYLSAAIHDALDRIEHAVTRTSDVNEQQRKIVLRVWPTFGARWLISRLASLPAAEIGVEIDIAIWVEPTVELRSVGADAAILFGTGDWPQLVSYKLAEEELVAVASPRAVERLGPDLAAYPWMHMSPRPGAWHRWVKARGQSGATVKEGPAYEVGMLIELACLGQGAAVLPKLYVERELVGGQLIAPFGAPLNTGRAYYLSYLLEDADKPGFAPFKDWLLGTC